MKLAQALGLALCCCLPSFAQSTWWKGNLHTHSFWSDGNDFPEMIVKWYRERGYHFLALSDHNILSEGEKWMDVSEVVSRARGDHVMARYREAFADGWVETRTSGAKEQVRLRGLAEFRGRFEAPGEFLLIPSEEISDAFRRKPIHINATNVRKRIEPQHGDSIRDTIRRNLEAVEAQAKETGRPIIPHVNHPNFGWAITAEDLAHVVQDRFFEVWNGHPSINHRGDAEHAGVERMWDIANTIRIGELKAPPLFGLGVDDAHHYHGRQTSRPGRGWIMIRATKLTPKDLLAAMSRGDFYASSGVTLEDVTFDETNRRLTIRIAKDGDATFTTRFLGTLQGYDSKSEPVVNENEREIRVSRRYSPDVGKLLAEVAGPVAAYTLTGRELYVRATITSSRPHPDPTFRDQKQQAWTQPVGW